ncbi:MAG: CopD family protein, partial [Chloroflexi bacterium]|nr:CopD family protein [Chloroflexota bacterium]
ATVIWLGGLALLMLVALPALQQRTLGENQWLALQQRFTPWANVSLVVLLLTGFVQMTNDPNYTGFLQVDSVWAGAILVKHIAFAGMVGLSFYLQRVIYPAMERAKLLGEKRPQLAASEQAKLQHQEHRLLWLNVLCAAAILLCTAIATAI